jgi:NADPH:quinone reductase-like Zn-dependent oxidoreductase
VRLRVTGVNPGDWRLREGAYGIAGPAVLGREAAGTVLASGPDVTGFAPDDEVFGATDRARGVADPGGAGPSGLVQPVVHAVSTSVRCGAPSSLSRSASSTSRFSSHSGSASPARSSCTSHHSRALYDPSADANS